MDEITMQFGSHVYGTNTTESDTDYKTVFIPKAEDILLQRVVDAYRTHTKEDEHAKNTKNDTDRDFYSLKKYMGLLLAGDTMALDMLFTPAKFYTSQHVPGWWVEIRFNKQKFIHKGTAKFAEYCKGQADKYGIKGSRVAAFRIVRDDLLAASGTPHTVGDMESLWATRALENTFIKIVEVEQKTRKMDLMPSTQMIKHLDVCGKMIPFSTKLPLALTMAAKWVDEYGERALQAEKNEGIDFKACMHAIRVASQAKELLLTGRITFPRPDAEYLLKIRNKEIHSKEIFEKIEQGLVELEEARLKSTLHETPDLEWCNKLICHHYGEEVMAFTGAVYKEHGENYN